MIKDTAEFLQYMVAIWESGSTDSAADFIRGEIDIALGAGEHKVVNNWLEDLADDNGLMEYLDTTLMVTFLSATRAAKSELPARQAFYEEVREYLITTRVDCVLIGLG